MSKLKMVAGIGVAGILGLVMVAGGAFAYMGSAANSRLNQTWPDVKGKDLQVPFPLTEDEVAELRAEKLEALTKAAEEAGEEPPGEDVDPLEDVDLEAIAMERAVARGQRMVTFQLGCVECHGADGAGKLVADAQPVWTWYAPNITSGGRTKDYSTADWDRIIRHGVKPDHTNATMPAVDFMRLADRDVSDIIAWAKSLEPSDTVQPDTVIGPVGKMLIGSGTLPIAAEDIDHTVVNPEYPPERAVTVEYGQYVAQTCVGCHQLDFAGGPIAQGPPDWPPGGNLTPHADGLEGWSKDDWMGFWKTGKRPDGTSVDPVMAWALMGQMGDVELEAMYTYLQTVEAKPTPQ